MTASRKLLNRGAECRSFRLIFLVWASVFLAVSCTQTKLPANDPPVVATNSGAARPPKVTQIDDARVKEILKPKGKPLLVNFWATWCGPCREEFPDLVKIDSEFRGQIDFVTISLDFIEELDAGVPKFLSEMNATMPTYVLISADENAIIPSIHKDWSGALPFTMLYNEKGEVVYSRQERIDPETLKGEIEKTLGK